MGASPKLARRLGWIGVVLSIIGLLVSIYLTFEHYTGNASLACSDSGLVNCGLVTTSSYSVIFGIPLPLLGLGFFIAMIPFQSPLAWRSTNRLVHLVRLLLAASGIPMIFWLIYVELFKLNALCLYCTAVHGVTLVLFALTLIGSALMKAETETPAHSAA